MSLNVSPELEQRVLQTLMSIGESHDLEVQNAMLKLDIFCFYNTAHAILFKLIKNNFNNKETFNFVDILSIIPKEDINTYETLHWLMEKSIEAHFNKKHLAKDIDKLLTLALVRKQLGIIDSTLTEIKEIPDPFEAQKLINNKITEISNLNFNQTKYGKTNIELAEDYYNGVLADNLIIPTTLSQFNLALGGGIRSKSLITIAGAPGRGKTGFAIYLLDAIARNQLDRQNLFFSLEMESKHIWSRHIGICAGKLFDDLTPEQRSRTIPKALMIPLTCYDCSQSTHVSDLDFILTTCRLKAIEQPISVIVIDYLGLVQNKGIFDRNDLKQSDITNKLAALALELDCIVIALSQVNRNASQRAKDDQCPYPSDAADSSGSERSSTLWFGIDRPELYLDDLCYRNQFVLKCRKNRFGDTFTQLFAFNGGTFAEVPTGYFRQPYAREKNLDEALFS